MFDSVGNFRHSDRPEPNSWAPRMSYQWCPLSAPRGRRVVNAMSKEPGHFDVVPPAL